MELLWSVDYESVVVCVWLSVCLSVSLPSRAICFRVLTSSVRALLCISVCPCCRIVSGSDKGDPTAGQDGGDTAAPRLAQPQRRAVDQGEIHAIDRVDLVNVVSETLHGLSQAQQVLV